MRAILVAVFAIACLPALSQKILYRNGSYALYADSIVQGKFHASAPGRDELVSDYRSPANAYKSPVLVFKFALNGKDNEMVPGRDHQFVFPEGKTAGETPVIQFGKQLKPEPGATGFMPANGSLLIRLDLREVLRQFAAQGFYTNYKGDRIYTNDFKGVFIAGSTKPLSWDFDNLASRKEMQLLDEDQDSIYEIRLHVNPPEEPGTASHWVKKRDLSAFPSYHSDDVLPDALYKMATEEMINAVEPDSTFRTGKEWAGVWTRDISYSIILSMAHLQPRVAKYSLLRKVGKKKKIIQDTGTGGAWPVSTDRAIWAVAAWELYKVTGDRNWLKQAFEIVKNSLDADAQTAYDPLTGLVKGESSFLDWREQTYPLWMQPADIAESECLGTNAVHYEANRVLSLMAKALGKKTDATHYAGVAQRIKNGINTWLWNPATGYYGQYLYGRNFKILSPRSEALGEALVVLFGIAEGERAKTVIARTPVMDFGIPCIYPQIPGIPPYHNNAVWPFVQSYWAMAAAKVGNDASVTASLAAVYRPAALFVTNKENFVAENGDFQGTQINSSNMLWSLSGSLGIIHKVIFGIRFDENAIRFEPFVPRAFAGKRRLENFSWRNAVLDIELEGSGRKLRSVLLDGKSIKVAELPADISGMHKLHLTLEGNSEVGDPVQMADAYTTIATPKLYWQMGMLKWSKVPDVNYYQVIKNGKPIAFNIEAPPNYPPSFMIPRVFSAPPNLFSEYQVIAFDKNGAGSFASEPLVVADPKYIKIFELETIAPAAIAGAQGFSGNGFSFISIDSNKRLSVPVSISADGWYALDFRYANGNGPINTSNKCALRSLRVDDKQAGTALFPQRGEGEWNNWGFSNSNKVYLKKGKHTISLAWQPSNENMNELTNEARLDYLRLTRL
jgi:hypothetical protein